MIRTALLTLGFVVASAVSAGAVAIVCPSGDAGCGPIVQNPANDPTAMTILWWTDVAATEDDVVEYGTTLALGSSRQQGQPVCEAGTPGTCHRVDLTGLTPGTTYFYQLHSNGMVVQAANASVSIATLPSAGQAAHTLRWAVVGDFGSYDPVFAPFCYDAGTCPSQKIANQIAAKAPDLLFTVGDNEYGTSLGVNTVTSWSSKVLHVYREILKRVPSFFVIGNHDLRYGTVGNELGDADLTRWPGAPQKRIFAAPTNGDSGGDREEAWYYVTAGDALFVVVNTNWGPTGTQDWASGANQKAWLRDVLCTDGATSTKKWKFLFLHHLPYSCGTGRCYAGSAGVGMGCRTDADCGSNGGCSLAASGSSLDVRFRIGPIAEDCGVDVVFDGHEHLWERTRFMDDFDGSSPASDPAVISPNVDGKGTYYLTAGGGGASLDGQAILVNGLPTDQSGNVCRSGAEESPWVQTGCAYNGQNDLCSYSRKYSFAYATLTDDTTLTITGVDDDGTTFDTWTLTDGAPPPTGTPTPIPTPTRTPTASPTRTASVTPTTTPSASPGTTPSLTATVIGTPAPTESTVPIPTPTSEPMVCPAQPMLGCRRALRPDGGTLALTDRTPDKNDGVAWRWSRGPIVLRSAFGNPLATTFYRLCLYEAGGSLALGVTVPAGGVCGGRTKRPCWRVTRHGFSYRNPDRAAGAVQILDLREGAKENLARLAIRGRGPLLGMPSLGTLTLPLGVQLQSSDGACWEASYSPPPRRQSAKSLVARAD